MLRIITQRAEAEAELRRISDRTQDEYVFHKEATVREVLQAVKRQGDRALLHYTEEFDQHALSREELRVSGSELDAAYQQVPKELLDAIREAASKIEAFHRQRLPKSWVKFEENDLVIGKRYTPVERAGLYIAGGKVAYPTAVLMNAIPAKVAGVPRIIIVTPPGKEKTIHPAVLVAAQEAGVQEIYRVGGAQAIAALAYGTETIPKVDAIAGHGNIYVTLAKKQVYGTVALDGLGWPSELLIIADKSANPLHVAADIIAQAEKDPMAAAILLTPDSVLARKTVLEVERYLETHSRRTLTEKALAHYGLIVVIDSLATAAELCNQFGPQNLELQVAEPWELLKQIRHAGNIFLGGATPQAVGDSLTGINYSLPANGAARYSSPVSVETFMKHSNLIEYSPLALQKAAHTLQVLANAEGFPSRADSVRLRTQTRQI